MVTGVISYLNGNAQRAILGYLSLIFFFFLWIIAEIAYQIYLRRTVIYEKLDNSMSVDEFNKKIA